MTLFYLFGHNQIVLLTQYYRHCKNFLNFAFNIPIPHVLTFLASHNCLGSGLFTPSRFSSLGTAGNENTAEEKC